MNKNVTVASLALLVAVMAVPLGGAYAAGDKDPDPAGTKTIAEFSRRSGSGSCTKARTKSP